MLDLRRDLYARLVISAHKDRALNKPFRVIHADKWDNSALRNFEMPSKFEEAVEDISLVHSIHKNNLLPLHIPYLVHLLEEEYKLIMHNQRLSAFQIYPHSKHSVRFP